MQPGRGSVYCKCTMRHGLALVTSFLLFLSMAEAATFGAVQSHGEHQPALRALDQIVLRDLRGLIEAYEQGSHAAVGRYVGGNFESRDDLGFGYNVTRLGLSVASDVRNLRGIQFEVDTALPQYAAGFRQARVDLRWNRRARFSGSGEEWVTRSQRSTLLFQIQGERAYLVAIQGAPMMGLTSPVGVLVVDRGSIDGKAVGQPRSVLNGRLGAGAQDLKSFGRKR